MEQTLIINSKSNEKVKFVKSLNDKKFRVKNEAFYLEGIKVVYEVLSKEKAIDVMFIAYSDEILNKTKQGIEALKKLNNKKYNDIKKYNFSEAAFDFMCDTVTPQGILVVLKTRKVTLENLIEDATNKNQNLLIVDKVQDAGNLGTIIRTANAFDINNIICIDGTVDVYSQKVLRSTMGTVLTTNIVYVSDNMIRELKKELNQNKFVITVTSLESKKYLEDLEYGNNKYAFVLGNEANGVSEKMINAADEQIKIRMNNNVESLNVSIASGILLYDQYKNKPEIKM